MASLPNLSGGGGDGMPMARMGAENDGVSSPAPPGLGGARMASSRRGNGDMVDSRSMSPRLARQASQQSNSSQDSNGSGDGDRSGRQRSSAANEQKMQKMLNNFKREIDR